MFPTERRVEAMLPSFGVAGDDAGSSEPTRARTATLRNQLIGVPARLARSAGRLALHLPQHWPWEAGLEELLRVALHDPLPSAV